MMADYNVHVYMRQDGLAGTVTADLEYPPRVAFVLLTQASHTASARQFISTSVAQTVSEETSLDVSCGVCLRCGAPCAAYRKIPLFTMVEGVGICVRAASFARPSRRYPQVDSTRIIFPRRPQCLVWIRRNRCCVWYI